MSIAIPGRLEPIHQKITHGVRIDPEEALQLYAEPDLELVGHLGLLAKRRVGGNTATYLKTRYFNYSNLCILSCQFCAFAARKRDAHAFELSIAEIVEKTKAALREGITEVHMVGGLHPSLKKEWYLELLSSLKEAAPGIHLKAFTAIEIRHLADRVFRMPLRKTLEILREHGLDSLTGGGAEIFQQEVRDAICKGKETAEEWKEVHRTWHRMGGRSTCTMLFGHVESLRDRVDHLSQLRNLQDETGGFTGFVPFAFLPDTPAMAHLPAATSEEQLRNIAVSRVFLDNISHVTAYWVSLGPELAAQSLRFGADDLHGTMVEEHVMHLAGVKTPRQMTEEHLCSLIRDAGFEPAQRDSHYRIIHRHVPVVNAPSPVSCAA